VEEGVIFVVNEITLIFIVAELEQTPFEPITV